MVDAVDVAAVQRAEIIHRHSSPLGVSPSRVPQGCARARTAARYRPERRLRQSRTLAAASPLAIRRASRSRARPTTPHRLDRPNTAAHLTARPFGAASSTRVRNVSVVVSAVYLVRPRRGPQAGGMRPGGALSSPARPVNDRRGRPRRRSAGARALAAHQQGRCQGRPFNGAEPGAADERR